MSVYFVCFQRQKREKKVYYIAEEVVKSEQVFVDVLKLLNVVCEYATLPKFVQCYDTVFHEDMAV